MRRLVQFILSHSIFISFCAAALSLQTLQLLSLHFNPYLLGFIFFATLAGYNAYWMISRYSFNQHIALLSFLQKNSSSFFVLLSAVAGLVYCFGKLHLVMYNVVITFILLGFYAIPVMPFKQLHFTRKAGFMKTILLAFTWAIVTTLIPLQISFLQMDKAEVLIFMNRFLFMLMLCIIFDKRDAAIDKIRGLQSLATGIKPSLLHYLIAIIFISYLYVSYLLSAHGVRLPEVAALMVAGLATVFVYISSLKKRGYFFYYFLVDGLMCLSTLLTSLATIPY
ncbi:MAG: hypothetical protein ABIN01_13165 [Ferruginibacter sp.]